MLEGSAGGVMGWVVGGCAWFGEAILNSIEVVME